MDPVWTTLFDVFACVLAGDEEEVYWCCGRLADRSIVVMDGQGSYYHVEKGKRKRYIACNNPEAGEEDFDSAVKRLKEEAGRQFPFSRPMRGHKQLHRLPCDVRLS